MNKLKFALDSDPYQGGHRNNLEVVKSLFPESKFEESFEGFGITEFTIETEISRDTLKYKLQQLYLADKIRGAQLRKV